MLLKPVAIFPDPFRGAPHLLVLAECIDPSMKPIETNTRAAAKAAFDAKLDEVPWFGTWGALAVQTTKRGCSAGLCWPTYAHVSTFECWCRP